jgi:hypothetical protein
MWAPLKKDTLDALAAEILHNYGSGSALVAITATDEDTATAFARDLGASLEDAGRSVAFQSGANTVPPRTDDTLTLVTGAVTTDAAATGHWNYLVWLENGSIERTTRAAASAIVDVTDPDHPRRVFADSC